MTDEFAAGGSREVHSDHRAQRLVRCAVHARMMKLKEMIIFTINHGIKKVCFPTGKHTFSRTAKPCVMHSARCITRAHAARVKARADDE